MAVTVSHTDNVLDVTRDGELRIHSEGKLIIGGRTRVTLQAGDDGIIAKGFHTTDPMIRGMLWNNNGTLAVSAGPSE